MLFCGKTAGANLLVALPARRRTLRVWSCVMAGLLAVGPTLATGAERLELAWPTPNRAWLEGQPVAQLLQHAGSGDPESGGFGGVRGSGAQFHEGIDIKAVARDRQGTPTDNVMAAMAGVVRYINPTAGDSSYGRYVVLEHPGETPGVYTLYAHLARLAPGLRAGSEVRRGQVLGIMGHSSGGYMIPKARAHLHFEIGVMVTRNFQTWYDRQKFGSRNEHGLWNGMNLMGLDPLALFDGWRQGRISSVRDYFASMPTAVRVRIATHRVPDFVQRYPSLLTAAPPLGLPHGWEIRFGWTGLPLAWTPLTAAEAASLPRDRPLIVQVDAELERRQKSKSLAVLRRGRWTVGKDLEIVLGQLFVLP